MRIKLAILLSTICLSLLADNYYYVELTDKAGCEYTLQQPENFLSDRALTRRTTQHIAIDSTDLPVSPIYTDSLQALGANLVHTSRWLNAVTILLPNSFDTARITQLSFVKSMHLSKISSGILPSPAKAPTADSLVYGLATTQIQMLQLDKVHRAGFRGQGMQIAVIDNGFPNVNSAEAFAIARTHILGTYNLAPPFAGTVYEYGGHGTSVFSAMAARLDSTYCGASPDADYYLFRTEEDNSETPLEMDNWIAAAEKADSLGVDIISTSLGYYIFTELPEASFTQTDLNGRTARISRAATMATRKGILVVCSAGNEGYSTWRTLIAPSDADSILCVGSVNAHGEHSYFSSVGNSADGRIKPDICAMGEQTALVSSGTESIIYSNGTSFSTPIAAGMAASLWSANPTLSNISLRQYILESSSQYALPDSLLGYGIPNAWAAYKKLMPTSVPSTANNSTFAIYPNPAQNEVNINSPQNTAYTWSISDMRGTLLGQGSKYGTTSIAIGHLPAGCYSLRIVTGDGKQTTHKLLKKP